MDGAGVCLLINSTQKKYKENGMRKKLWICLCALAAFVCALFAGCGKDNVVSSSWGDPPKVKIEFYETVSGEGETLYRSLSVYQSCHGLESGTMFFGYDETYEMPTMEKYVFKGVWEKPNGGGQCLIADTGHSEINFYSGKEYKGYIYFKEENFDAPTAITPIDVEGAYFTEEMPESIEQGAQMKLPIPYIQGKKFVGWNFTDGKQERFTDEEGNMLAPWNVHLYDTEIKAWFVESDVKYIFDEEGFRGIANEPNIEYELLTNVELDEAWTPFDFGGTLNGNGYTVKGLDVTGKGDLGVFLNLSGTVKDIVFEDISVISPSVTIVNVGGVCATLSGNLSNIKFSGIVQGDYANLGGFAGVMDGGSIQNCINEAVVETQTYEVESTCGGIVGRLKNGEILDCENHGNVSGYGYVGGVIGGMLDSRTTKTRRLLNVGEVVGRGDCVGGIMGVMKPNNCVITTSEYENRGNVTGKNSVGGIFGQIYCEVSDTSDETFLNEFAQLVNSGNITGENSVGGCVGELFFQAYETWGRNPKSEFKGTDFINTGNVAGVSLVGGIVGEGYAQVKSSKIIRSSSSGSVTAMHTVGGLVGSLENIALVSCSNEGASVTATGHYIEGTAYFAKVGGFAGIAYAVEDCHNKVEISYGVSPSSLAMGDYIGGIAGLAKGDLTDCSNEKDVCAPYSRYVGGIAGDVSVDYEYVGTALSNLGKVTGTAYVGGIIGNFSAKLGVNDSKTHTVKFMTLTNTGDVEGGSYSAGIIGKIYAEGIPQNAHNSKVRVTLTNVQCRANVNAVGENPAPMIGYFDTDSNESVLNACVFEGSFNERTEGLSLVGGYRLIDEAPCFRIT